MRAWLLPLLALPLASCDAGTPLQLVSGSVQTVSGAMPSEVRAEADGELVGTAPVGEDGAFLLALPAGDAIRLGLAGGEGELPVVIPGADRAPVPLELRICAPGEKPLLLGSIYVGAPCHACDREERAMHACERDAEDHDICPHCDDCRQERSELDRCLEQQQRECAVGPVARAAPPPFAAIGCAP